MIKIVCDICGQPCNQHNPSKTKYYIVREDLGKKPEKARLLIYVESALISSIR